MSLFGGNGAAEPEGTGSMWLRMLGLEDLFRAAQSPEFQAQLAGLYAAIMETAIRVERIEFKLDALLDRMGHDDIPRRPAVARIPASRPSDGPRIPATTGVATDAGGGEPADADGPDRVEPIGAGGGDHVR